MGFEKKPFFSNKIDAGSGKNAGGKAVRRPFSLRTINVILLFFLVLAVVAAGYAGAAYHLPAGASRNVELTVRYSDLQIFAARAGLTAEEALRFLKERGVTSVGVAEYTLWQLRKDPGYYVLSNLELVGELALNRELAPYRQFLEQKAQEAGFSFGDYLVFMPAGPWAEQVGAHLRALYTVAGEESFRLTTYRYGVDGEAGERVLYLLQGVNYDLLPHLSLGAKPALLEQVAAAGLRINPYLKPRTIETPEMAEQMLTVYERYPLSAAVFESGVVPGNPAALPELAAALRARGIPAALYEYHLFPRGMKELAPLLDYQLVVMRPGSILDDPRSAINGLRERRVQLLELELRGLASRRNGPALQEAVADHLSRLTAALQENGYNLGSAVPLQPFQGPFLLYLLMAAGVLALALFLLQFFLPLASLPLLGLFVLGLAALTLLLQMRFLLMQQALALLAAVFFPYYGALYLFTRPRAGANMHSEADMHNEADVHSEANMRSGDSMRRGAGTAVPFLQPGLFRHCLFQVFFLFLLSLAGGLLVHGLLTTPPFFHGLEFFRGVKAMYILPLALAGLTALALPAAFSSPVQPQGQAQGPGQGEGHGQDQSQDPTSPAGNENAAPNQAETGSFSCTPVPASHRSGSFFPFLCKKFQAFLGVTTRHSSLFPLQLPAAQREAFYASLRRFLRRSLTTGDLLLLALVLLGAFIYLTRTGHVKTILPLEGTLRNTLEQLFGARPRFKEYALGYPLALLGLYLTAAFSSGLNGKVKIGWNKAYRYLALAALLGGVLAPISVVNTFAHTLAPQSLSLLRSFHGFWLGCLIGSLFILCGGKIIHPCLFTKSGEKAVIFNAGDGLKEIEPDGEKAEKSPPSVD